MVGQFIRQRYDEAIQVTVDQSGGDLVLAASGYPQKPAREELVFLEESPDYCVPNQSTGSLGTGSRECNRTSTGVGGCGVLCCGRGFNTIEVEKNFDCSCKFHWCCYVKCQKCRKKVDIHVCKKPEDVRAVSSWHQGDTTAHKKRNNKKASKKGKKRRHKNQRKGADRGSSS